MPAQARSVPPFPLLRFVLNVANDLFERETFNRNPFTRYSLVL